MNLFNPLNGKEAKQAIINEISRALDSDSEFREHLTFPRVSWKWRLEMDIYPRTPSEKIVEAADEIIQMERDENGNLMPVVDAKETHVREVLRSTPREINAPDAIRETEGLTTETAQIGGIRTARKAEVGKAAENPTVSPGLNR
jgi:hypothetical protein